jgi:hypothetical protein
MAVVSKSINWDNQVWIKAVNAVAELNGYQSTILDENGQPISNPQSNIQFFNAWLKKQAINAITERDNRAAIAAVVPVIDTEV